MKLVKLLKGAALGAVLGAASALTPSGAAAQETFKVGICYDLSRSYTFISPQVVQAAQPGVADVHRRPLADGLQPLEHLDALRGIGLRTLGGVHRWLIRSVSCRCRPAPRLSTPAPSGSA